jgi:hypothetical protein
MTKRSPLPPLLQRKKGAAVSRQRPKWVGYWKASDAYDTGLVLPRQENLLSKTAYKRRSLSLRPIFGKTAKNCFLSLSLLDISPSCVILDKSEEGVRSDFLFAFPPRL